ncbi:hypothetical protein CF328_g9210 [Tilletia controversa]|nr:hypothetical protein CF328_g9210 [Tilletia controversa]
MPAHRKKKSVPDAAHASLFTLPRRPGYDSITKQYWCGCAVNGCSSSGQALSPVSKRTWHSHKRDQEFFELRQAIERADPIPSRGILQESRIQSASSALAISTRPIMVVHTPSEKRAETPSILGHPTTTRTACTSTSILETTAATTTVKVVQVWTSTG